MDAGTPQKLAPGSSRKYNLHWGETNPVLAGITAGRDPVYAYSPGRDKRGFADGVGHILQFLCDDIFPDPVRAQ